MNVENVRITDDYVFFWKSPLSNWYKGEFDHAGTRFNCSEQAMMYYKALMFDREGSIADKILKEKNSREQQNLGRQVNNFNKDIWDVHSSGIMIAVLYAKFTSTPAMIEYILQFGNRRFVEGSPTDKIWGIGIHWEDELANDPNNWTGQNRLGDVLTIVRNLIKAKYRP
jgi:ribA/ribD-fused uncharacterized protein